MFEVGEKVVCISNMIGNNRISRFIKINKIYTINKYKKSYKIIELLEIQGCHYSIDHFITLSEFRKQKIKKICSRLETK